MVSLFFQTISLHCSFHRTHKKLFDEPVGDSIIVQDLDNCNSQLHGSFFSTIISKALAKLNCLDTVLHDILEHNRCIETLANRLLEGGKAERSKAPQLKACNVSCSIRERERASLHLKFLQSARAEFHRLLVLKNPSYGNRSNNMMIGSKDRPA